MACHMACGDIFTALLTRFLFLAHVLVSVGLSYLHKQNERIWFLIILFVPFTIETIVIVARRKGQEYKYFWPSCFLYLSAMLPIIWIMELGLLKNRLVGRDRLESKLPSIVIKGHDIRVVFNDAVAAKMVGELGVVIFIIIGRWLLPRGQLTRDQLSTLLLGYIGTGADILDLFSSLSDDKIAYNVNIHYVTLVVFSWSMLQFCITATASAGSDDSIVEGRTEIAMESAETVSTNQRPHRSDYTNTAFSTEDGPRDFNLNRSSISSSTANKPKRCWDMDADLLQILVPMLMQDGPFLALRLLMWIKFNVNNDVHIYFTGKNVFTLALLLYRLYCLKVKSHPNQVIPFSAENQGNPDNTDMKKPGNPDTTDMVNPRKPDTTDLENQGNPETTDLENLGNLETIYLENPGNPDTTDLHGKFNLKD